MAPSLYVGETSRSVQERAAEHWGAARKEQEKSHIHKHQRLEHPGEKPSFIFKVVSSHKTALSRQIKEAVIIRRRGGAGSILNSKGEYNQCHIPRLVVEPDDEESNSSRKVEEQQAMVELVKSMNEEEVRWRDKKTREQELARVKRRRKLSKDDKTSSMGVGRRPKKLKFTPLLEDWEEEDEVTTVLRLVGWSHLMMFLLWGGGGSLANLLNQRSLQITTPSLNAGG